MPPPYSVDRGWATGESRNITVSGGLTLHKCGGTFVKTDPDNYAGCSVPYDSGWILGDTFAPFTHHCDFGPSVGMGHDVVVEAFGFTYRIATESLDRDPPFADYAWRTAFYHDGNLVGTPFDDPAEPDLESTTPEEVTAEFSVSFQAEKWIFELDNGTLIGGPYGGENVRPRNQLSSNLYVVWRVTSDVTSAFLGDTLTKAKEEVYLSIPSPVSIVNGFDCPAFPTGVWYIETQMTEYFRMSATPDSRGKGGLIYDLLPEADGKGAMPYGTVLAEVFIGEADGPMQAFTSDSQWISPPSDPCGTHLDSGNKLRDYSLSGDKYQFTFKQPNLPYSPPFGKDEDYAQDWKGHHLSQITLKGTVRDWEKELNNFQTTIPVFRLYCDEILSANATADFSGTVTEPVRDFIYPEIATTGKPQYGGIPPYRMVMQYGPTWAALKVEHAASLLVEDFKKAGVGANDWLGSPRTLESDNLRVDAGTGVSIVKTLKNDFKDMADDPAAWWTAHKNTLTGLPTALRTQVKTWGDVTNNLHRIGRKMLSGSDEFNWSSYRYAYLKAKGNTSANLTLTVTFREYNVTDIPDNGDAHDFELVFTVPITTTATEHEIDLASQPTVFQLGFPQYLSGYQESLRYITKLKIDVPNGVTVNLYSITLKHKVNPVIEVHKGDGDPGIITGVVDGKHGLFLSTGERKYSSDSVNSRWGWPGSRNIDYSSVGSLVSGYYSSTIEELATEISLQAGWTATTLDQPTHDRGSYASDLLEVFAGSAGETLYARRHYGYAYFSPNMSETLDLYFNFGNAIDALVYDPDTLLPASTQVSLSGKDPDTLVENQTDQGHSDAKGFVQLQMTRGEPYSISTNDGAHTFTGGSERDTLDFPYIYGKGSPASGNPSLVTSSDLETYVAIIKDSTAQCARIRGVETDWQYFHVATGLNAPDICKNERLKDYPIYITGHLDGPPKKVLLLKNKHYGEPSDIWKIKVVAEGSNARIEIEESLGILFISFWRANNFYLKKTSDEGATWLDFTPGVKEAVIKTGVPEGSFDMGFLSTKDRTMIGVYQDISGNLQSLKSTNLGETWA